MKHNLIEEFHLDQVKFVNFLRTIESGHSDNPYHNATHVADVVQSMHCLVSSTFCLNLRAEMTFGVACERRRRKICRQT